MTFVNHRLSLWRCMSCRKEHMCFIHHIFPDHLALCQALFLALRTEVNDTGKVQTLLEMNNRQVHAWRENKYFRL